MSKLMQAYDLLQKKSFAACFDACQQGLRDSPQDGNLWHIQALALAEMERTEEAITSLKHALSLLPQAQIWRNLGKLYRSLERYELALDAYQQALALEPDHPDTLCRAGLMLEKLSRPLEAIAAYRQALHIKPDDGNAANNLAVLLRRQGEGDAAQALYRQAADSGLVSALRNLANFYLTENRLQEAADTYRQVLTHDAKNHEALLGLGVVHQEGRHWHEAKKYFEQALAMAPDDLAALSSLLFLEQNLGNHTRVAELQRQMERSDKFHSGLLAPFSMLALYGDPAQQLEIARRFSERSFGKVVPLPPQVQRPLSGRRLRLGYLSSDLRQHPVGHLCAELFELHDFSRVDVTVFSTLTVEDDAVNQRIRKALAERYVDVARLSPAELATRLREHNLDMLIDLIGYTQGSRAAALALKPVPIQINYLGYPATTGAAFIDYIIADNALIPKELDHFYSEKVIRLPSWQANDRKKKIGPPERRADHGIPEEAFVLCCFNSPYKISRATFELWMHLLHQLPEAVLWLFAQEPDVKEHFWRDALRLNIDPTRIIFGDSLSYERYLARYQLADLFLDTQPFNAVTTASDALWAGLPVLSWQQQSFAGRGAASVLTALGMTELITHSQEHYIERAIHLARHRDELQSLRTKLWHQRENSRLFDSASFVRDFENALLELGLQELG